MEDRWIDRLCHVIADYEIPVRGSEIPAEPGAALVKRFVTVRQLAQAAEYASQGERSTVEAIFGSDLKLLSDSQRFVALKAREGSVVGNEAKNVAALVFGGVATFSVYLSTWLRRLDPRDLLAGRHPGEGSESQGDI